MSEQVTAASGWKRFWERGGWWRAVLLAVVYLALYLATGQLVGLLFGSQIDDGDPLADVPTIFFGTALAIIVGSAILLLFSGSLGWLRELFGRQPIGGSWWMWIAPAIVLAAALLRIFGTDYGRYSVGVVIAIYLTGLCIGFAEELLTRGLAVNLLRKGGYSERVVMLLSSLIFSLLHSVNLLTGQPPLTVLVTMGFTFVFGVAMYLTLRVTGSLIWPMLLHAITDPSTMLAVGGVDETHGSVDQLASLAGASTYLYLLLAIVAIFLVRDRVGRKDAVLGLVTPEGAGPVS